MNPLLKKQLLKTFSQMIDDLDGLGEIEMFLKDFFDDAELEKYIKRIAVAYWLKKGRDEENIKINLLVNLKEITETKKLLKKNGVKLALKKIEADEWANVWAKRIKKLGTRH